MMTDDRLAALFEGYERPVEPDPAFLERLHGELRRHAGFERRPIGWRLRAAADTLAPRLAPPLRVAWTLALIAALAAAALGAALVGARLFLSPSPDDLVRASQAVSADPPAFELEAELAAMCPAFARPIGDAGGEGCRVRVSFDGHARLRIDRPAGDAYALRDGRRHGWYASAEFGPDTWWVDDLPDELARIEGEYPLLGVGPGWIDDVPIAAGGQIPWPACPAGWTLGEPDRIADRWADEVRCGPASWWIDRDSRLVLRRSVGALVTGEVTWLDLDPDFPTDRFAFDPPAGATVVGGDRPSRPGPAIGERLPDLQLPLLDGGRFDPGRLVGRPAVIYLWAPWCAPCTGTTATTILDAAAAHGDAVQFVTIGLDARDSLADSRSTVGLLPIAVDAGSDAFARWDLDAIPTVIVLDADARVVAVRTGAVDRAGLDRMLASLAP